LLRRFFKRLFLKFIPLVYDIRGMDHLRAAIIDDDDEILDLIEQILKEEGVGTQRYAKAEKLLDDIKERGFDMIITDLVLPEMSGLDLLNELNSRGMDIPVVIITGYASLDSAIEAVNRGAFYYIKKPFNIEEIRFVINRLRQRLDTLEAMRSLQDRVNALEQRLEKMTAEGRRADPLPLPFDFLQSNMDAGKAIAAIEYLGKLKSDGLISDTEFGEYKGKILKRVI
jgi:FixJ family two-component response regulator